MFLVLDYGMWSRRVVLATTVIFAISCGGAEDAGGQAASVEIANIVEAGQVALTAQDFGRAGVEFDEALRIATEFGDEWSQARVHFFLGRTSQLEAQYIAPDQERIRLNLALGHYDRALELLPESGAILNNRALVLEELGDTDSALAGYERAIALNDTDQATYFENYADLLNRGGRVPEAALAYRRLFQVNPENVRAQSYLTRHYTTEEPGELIPFLWELVGAEQVLGAQGTALDLLEAGAEPGETLLTVVAFSLSRQSYDPREFADSEVGVRLSSLMERGGVAGLLALHEGPTGEGSSWWINQWDPFEDPPRGMWPRDAYRALERTLGRWHRQQGHYELAAEYLSQAATVEQEEVDPLAVRELVQVYLEQGDLARLPGLLEEFDLYAAKAYAYRNSQVEKIYQLHATLGEIYGQLGVWGDEYTIPSAIFQLTHARDFALQVQELQGSAFDEDLKLLFGPELADLLAEGYRNTGDVQRSYTTRFQAAEMYEAVGAREAAWRVLAPLEEADLRSSERELFEEMRTRLRGSTVTPEAIPPGAFTVEMAPSGSRWTGETPVGIFRLTFAGLTKRGARTLEETFTVTREDLDLIGGWLAGYLGAFALGRHPKLPQDVEVGLVTGIRYAQNAGTVFLTRQSATFEVNFTLNPAPDLQLEAFRAGSATLYKRGPS